MHSTGLQLAEKKRRPRFPPIGTSAASLRGPELAVNDDVQPEQLGTVHRKPPSVTPVVSFLTGGASPTRVLSSRDSSTSIAPARRPYLSGPESGPTFVK